MNDLERRAEFFLAEITYKPGHRLSIGPDRATMPYGLPPGFTLRIEADVPDSRKPHHRVTVPVRVEISVDGYTAERVTENRETFFEWLRETLLWQWEVHERDEWLKVNGEMVVDPHAPGWRP